jgi:hypothetical protein
MNVVCASLLALAVGQTPTDEQFNSLRDQIVPAREELGWRSLNWHGTLWEAIQRGREDNKPILLYAMNGHPLACT